MKIKSNMDIHLIFTKGSKSLDDLLFSRIPSTRKDGLGYKESQQNSKGESSSRSQWNKEPQIYAKYLKGRDGKDERVKK